MARFSNSVTMCSVQEFSIFYEMCLKGWCEDFQSHAVVNISDNVKLTATPFLVRGVE